MPAGRIVIANTFYGNMPNLDTRLIGGTDFAPSQVYHEFYSIIGVSGAAPGQAYESWNAYRTSPTYFRSLVGSLMLDYSQRYAFVPSQFIEFELLPNQTAPGASNPGSTIVFAGKSYPSALPSGGIGGFQLMKVERFTGTVTFQRTYATNGPQAKAEIAALADQLSYVNDNLILMTTVGQPFGPGTYAFTPLTNAITNLRGVRYIIPRLAGPTPGGRFRPTACCRPPIRHTTPIPPGFWKKVTISSITPVPAPCRRAGEGP